MAAGSLALSAQWRTFHSRFKTRHGTRADSAARANVEARSINQEKTTMTPRPRLLLTTIFVFGMAVTAATLAAIGHVADAGAPARPAGARMREAPALAPTSQIHTLFLERRYAEAYGRYAELADAGDAAAASMALAMVMHGPALFGSDWSATSTQLQRWHALAQQFAVQREASIVAHDRGE
jgi:hypothetical protein